MHKLILSLLLAAASQAAPAFHLDIIGGDLTTSAMTITGHTRSIDVDYGHFFLIAPLDIWDVTLGAFNVANHTEFLTITINGAPYTLGMTVGSDATVASAVLQPAYALQTAIGFPPQFTFKFAMRADVSATIPTAPMIGAIQLDAPEPATFGIAGLGLLALATARRRLA